MRSPTDERHFAEFDLAHPEVWQEFERLAFLLIREEGLERYSSDAILHIIRFYMRGRIRDRSGFRINNDYSSFYSRKFRERHPEHAGFFEVRTAKVDRKKVAALAGE
jgi:hypothetical protein